MDQAEKYYYAKDHFLILINKDGLEKDVVYQNRKMVITSFENNS